MPVVKTVVVVVSVLGAAIATVAWSSGKEPDVARVGQLGDPAAPLSIAEWVHGDPVDIAEGRGEKGYLVEFWATWCPQCVKVSPKLSEIQDTYGERGLTVIAVTDEESDVVRDFVQDKGDAITYTVAIDKNQRTTVDYMAAFGLNGIPTAFLVDREGKIAWVGHPADPMMKHAIEGLFPAKQSAGTPKAVAAPARRAGGSASKYKP